MQSIKFEPSKSTQENIQAPLTSYLAAIAHRWDSGIRQELRRFAQSIWPDAHFQVLITFHSYRIRKQLEPGTMVWWIERDIPPFDRYRCEAFRVELSLRGPDQPQLVVRSGRSVHPVIPLNMENLKKVLIRAGTDIPLLIRRHFGSVQDP